MPYQSLVYQTTTTTGTGDLTVSASTTTGWRTLADAHGTGSGNLFRYCVRHQSAVEWEEGIGYMSDSTTLVRSAVLASSNSGAAVSFAAGTKEISADASAAAFGGMNAGDKVALALISEVVTASSQSDVTFSSIPATYRDLMLVVRGRGTVAAIETDVRIQLNGDTGTNYNSVMFVGYGYAAANFESLNAAQLTLGRIAGASSTTDACGHLNITLLDYRGTTFWKSLSALGGNVQGSATGNTNVWTGFGEWKSTAAVTSAKVFLSSGNFVDGSVVSLYGRM